MLIQLKSAAMYEIGGNVGVLPGITIGDSTVIGAGSVVTKDIRLVLLLLGILAGLFVRLPMEIRSSNPCFCESGSVSFTFPTMVIYRISSFLSI